MTALPYQTVIGFWLAHPPGGCLCLDKGTLLSPKHFSVFISICASVCIDSIAVSSSSLIFSSAVSNCSYSYLANVNFRYCIFLCVFLSFLVRLGFELRALSLQSRRSTTQTTFPVHFALVILEMHPHELFTQADLEP
jgi:hypothetical protein